MLFLVGQYFIIITNSCNFWQNYLIETTIKCNFYGQQRSQSTDNQRTTKIFQNQPSSTKSNQDQPRSNNINQDKPISTKINKDQPRLIKINQNQPTLNQPTNLKPKILVDFWWSWLILSLWILIDLYWSWLVLVTLGWSFLCNRN